MSRLTSAATLFVFAVCLLAGGRVSGQPTNAGPGVTNARATNYVLTASDLVHIRVFQEDDLETRARIDKDGTITFPLLGQVKLGGRSVEEASQTIRELLAKGYLVNPQVSVSVVEYAKRRFTVLGQVQRPGTYEIPDNQPLSLLQAIAMAGGYTRIAAPNRVVVQRQERDQRVTHQLDAKAMGRDKRAKIFEVQPEDVITVGESIF